jgi:hypothetical protein
MPEPDSHTNPGKLKPLGAVPEPDSHRNPGKMRPPGAVPEPDSHRNPGKMRPLGAVPEPDSHPHPSQPATTKGRSEPLNAAIFRDVPLSGIKTRKEKQLILNF